VLTGVFHAAGNDREGRFVDVDGVYESVKVFVEDDAADVAGGFDVEFADE